MTTFALLATALLFGGMTLYAGGFAGFLFTALPAKTASGLIRRAFPHFYLFVIGVSVLAGAAAYAIDATSALILLVVAVTAVLARQVLMPMINTATDMGARARFHALHSLSVVVTLAHIVASAAVLVRLAGA